MKSRTNVELTEAAASMRGVLDYFPVEEDSRKDAAVRRRLEGAVIATELASGQEPPRPQDE